MNNCLSLEELCLCAEKLAEDNYQDVAEYLRSHTEDCQECKGAILELSSLFEKLFLGKNNSEPLIL